MSKNNPSIRDLLSPSIEDYLKTIYSLQSEQKANTKNIAEKMGYSQASVTNMMKKLADRGLVVYESHRGVELTKSGEMVALEVIRHHRLLELYLTKVMGYSWDEVHAEAEKLEHHISEQFEEKISEMLGHPQFDPHGDPIPNKDGTLPDLMFNQLSEAQPDHFYVIKRINNQSPDFLRYIEELGLKPDAKLQVINKAPFNGPMTIKLNDERLIVGHEVVKQIQIEQISED